jgi:hypothetical protein
VVVRCLAGQRNGLFYGGKVSHCAALSIPQYSTTRAGQFHNKNIGQKQIVGLGQKPFSTPQKKIFHKGIKMSALSKTHFNSHCGQSCEMPPLLSTSIKKIRLPGRVARYTSSPFCVEAGLVPNIGVPVIKWNGEETFPGENLPTACEEVHNYLILP